MMLKVLGGYVNLVLQATLLWGKRLRCVTSAVLGKVASITVVNLIQLKKLGYWKFFESHLVEARFELI